MLEGSLTPYFEFHERQRHAEQIAVLEARIEELEKSKELQSTPNMHNPYASERRSASLPPLSQDDSSRGLFLPR
jgi:hypothetical protein